MIKHVASLCCLALAVDVGLAQACTADEAAAKAQELAAKVEEITQRDPQRAALLRQELKEAEPDTAADRLATDCEAYDQRLRELEAIGGEVEEQMQ
ncbi:hypothetical protein SAMN05216588_101327 [Pseudomonas flavescens]|uniref:Uncharacterized protein n=1 Tax=Phytopseudomonas flavescens TaxID=29435 RepID=A0A1G7XY20_9GAMM|nr:hypothetical protein [Pseudomonas flavescens]SDG89084.1 hypothetical protein SAMN05216588_101327 [Pseudomonas flavescens]